MSDVEEQTPQSSANNLNKKTSPFNGNELQKQLRKLDKSKDKKTSNASNTFSSEVKSYQTMIYGSKLKKYESHSGIQIHKIVGSVVFKSSEEKFLSTGFIIQKRVVLTSAHSIIMEKPENLFFKMNSNSEPKYFKITRIKKCQDYHKSNSERDRQINDWCFLQIEGDFTELNLKKLSIKLVFSTLNIFNSFQLQMGNVAGFVQKFQADGQNYEQGVLYHSQGKINCDDKWITHGASTSSGMSGSPIYVENEIYGMHISGNSKKQVNKGISLSYTILQQLKAFISNRNLVLLKEPLRKDIQIQNVIDLYQSTWTFQIDLRTYLSFNEKISQAKLSSNEKSQIISKLSFVLSKQKPIILNEILLNLQKLMKLQIYPKEIKLENVILMKKEIKFKNLEVISQHFSTLCLKNSYQRRQLQGNCLISIKKLYLQHLKLLKSQELKKKPELNQQLSQFFSILFASQDKFLNERTIQEINQFSCCYFSINYEQNQSIPRQNRSIDIEKYLTGINQQYQRINNHQYILNQLLECCKLPYPSSRANKYAILMKNCNINVEPIDLETQLILRIHLYIQKYQMFLTLCQNILQYRKKNNLQIYWEYRTLQIEKMRNSLYEQFSKIKLTLSQKDVDQIIRQYKQQFDKNLFYKSQTYLHEMAKIEVIYNDNYFTQIISKECISGLLMRNSQILNIFKNIEDPNPLCQTSFRQPFQTPKHRQEINNIILKFWQDFGQSSYGNLDFQNRSFDSQKLQLFDDIWRQTEGSRAHILQQFDQNNANHKIYKPILNQVGKILEQNGLSSYLTIGNGFLIHDKYVITAGHVTRKYLSQASVLKFKLYGYDNIYNLTRVVSESVMETQNFKQKDMVIFQIHAFQRESGTIEQVNLVFREIGQKQKKQAINIPAALIGFLDQKNSYEKYGRQILLIAQGYYMHENENQMIYHFETSAQMSGSLIAIPSAEIGIIGIHNGARPQNNIGFGTHFDQNFKTNVQAITTTKQVKIQIKSISTQELKKMAQSNFIYKLTMNSCPDIFLLKFIDEIAYLNHLNIYLKQLNIQDIYIDYDSRDHSFLKFNKMVLQQKPKNFDLLSRKQKKEKIRTFEYHNLQIVMDLINKIGSKSQVFQTILKQFNGDRQIYSLSSLKGKLNQKYQLTYSESSTPSIKLKINPTSSHQAFQRLLNIQKNVLVSKENRHLNEKPHKRLLKIATLLKMYPKLNRAEHSNVVDLIMNSQVVLNTQRYYKQDITELETLFTEDIMKQRIKNANSFQWLINLLHLQYKELGSIKIQDIPKATKEETSTFQSSIKAMIQTYQKCLPEHQVLFNIILKNEVCKFEEYYHLIKKWDQILEFKFRYERFNRILKLKRLVKKEKSKIKEQSNSQDQLYQQMMQEQAEQADSN